VASPKRINLALQGGGAHGAFTWGVLDRLLECPEIEIAGISGTSAGALNGAALKAGMVQGGPEEARANLDWLWTEVGGIRDSTVNDWIVASSPAAAVWAKLLEVSPAYKAFDMTSRMLSPYVFGEAIKNPLERIVRHIRFEDVCSDAAPALYIGATNVRSGKIKVFAGDEIGPEAIMASACLPTLFQAVEIDDPATGRREAYWDGGYSGNPALFPLFEPDLPDDILVVNINPLYRDAVPDDVQSIQNRINEISFNSSLLRELRAIDFVQRLIVDGTLPKGAMKQVLVHMISDDDLMNTLNVATKTIPTPVILAKLKAAGRDRADAFLDAHLGDVNTRSTVDLRAMFA